MIWANITDVIDDQEVKVGQREDGTVYAVYSFARKVGQALAGGLGGWALEFIGYESAAAAQSDSVLSGLYAMATIAPALGFFAVARSSGLSIRWIRRAWKKMALSCGRAEGLNVKKMLKIGGRVDFSVKKMYIIREKGSSWHR